MARLALPPHDDATARFEALYARASAGEPTLPAEAAELVVVTVPGIFASWAPGYMDANEERLRALGLDVRRAGIDTGAAPEANAAAIAAAVREAARFGRCCVIFGHSKGATDAHAALALHPDVAPSVRAFACLQAPWSGSRVAEALLRPGLLGELVRWDIANLLQGDPAALAAITPAERRAFLSDHPLPAGPEVVSLASTCSAPTGVLVAPAAWLELRHGLASDGFLALDEAVVPGSRAVIVRGLDHAGAVGAAPELLCPWDAGLLSEALLALALGA